MLIQCRNCGVSYDSGIGRCVVCGEGYVRAREEMLADARCSVQQLLASGMKEPEIRNRLSSDFGLSKLDVDAVLRQERSHIRAVSRRHGRHLATSGVLLLIGAVGLFLISGGFIATAGLGLGMVMVGFGTLKSLTGWNISGMEYFGNRWRE